MKLNLKSLKDKNTLLNSYIEENENKILDSSTRDELANLSTIFWQDQFFMQSWETQKNTFENDKYRNYYEAYSMLTLPVMHKSRTIITNKISGFVKTPWYGEPFDENVFETALTVEYYIWFPSNFQELLRLYPGLCLVMHFHIDVGIYPGIENVKLGIVKDIIFDGGEPIIQSGNKSVIRKMGEKDIKRKIEINTPFVEIHLIRFLDKKDFDQIPVKRNTGFQLAWYYEDGVGNRIENIQFESLVGQKIKVDITDNNY